MDRLREIGVQLEILQKEQREIRNKLQDEDVKRFKEEFEKIRGRVYWEHLSGFNQNHTIQVMKVISCEQWYSFGSCNVLKIQIHYNGEKFTSFSITKDTKRVDGLNTKHCPEITEDKFEEFKQMAIAGIMDSFKTITE